MRTRRRRQKSFHISGAFLVLYLFIYVPIIMTFKSLLTIPVENLSSWHPFFFSWQLYYRFDKAHLQLKGILFCHFSPGMWDSLVVGRVFEKKMTSPVSKVFKLIRCCWCCCPCNNSISQSYILIVDISVVNDARSGWPFLCFGFLLPSISVTVFFF